MRNEECDDQVSDEHDVRHRQKTYTQEQRWSRVPLLGHESRRGIHVEEEFDPCIRVNGLLSPDK
jgi:hypothetical protein